MNGRISVIFIIIQISYPDKLIQGVNTLETPSDHDGILSGWPQLEVVRLGSKEGVNMVCISCTCAYFSDVAWIISNVMTRLLPLIVSIRRRGRVLVVKMTKCTEQTSRPSIHRLVFSPGLWPVIVNPLLGKYRLKCCRICVHYAVAFPRLAATFAALSELKLKVETQPAHYSLKTAKPKKSLPHRAAEWWIVGRVPWVTQRSASPSTSANLNRHLHH